MHLVNLMINFKRDMKMKRTNTSIKEQNLIPIMGQSYEPPNDRINFKLRAVLETSL